MAPNKNKPCRNAAVSTLFDKFTFDAQDRSYKKRKETNPAV